MCGHLVHSGFMADLLEAVTWMDLQGGWLLLPALLLLLLLLLMARLRCSYTGDKDACFALYSKGFVHSATALGTAS
jgi:hypothetical protein